MSKQNKTRLLLDLGTFVLLLVVSAPRATGNTLHEWLALALSGGIVMHLLLNWKWIVEVTYRLSSKYSKGTLVNYILNWGLFSGVIMIMLSGLMISKTVVPFFGISLPESMSWRQLHELSTNIVMILMGLHVALHWSGIVNMFKNIFVPRISSRTVPQALFMQKKDIQL
jgi:hypothetical protein